MGSPFSINAGYVATLDRIKLIFRSLELGRESKILIKNPGSRNMSAIGSEAETAVTLTKLKDF